MIELNTISFKNFFSVGNNPIKYELDKYGTTVLTGFNGCGKSILAEAITFALFGKPFRNINKSQIVNTLNGKDCLVTLNLTHNGRKYKIKRGIKPNLFEITIDGKVRKSLASVKEEQDWLEKTLQLNYKTFIHISILGNCNYTPFMEKSASERRSFIEDILGLTDFSSMKSTTKEKIKGTKDTIKELKSDILSLNSQRTILQHSIDTVARLIEEQKKDKKDEIDLLTQELLGFKKEFESENNILKNLESALKDIQNPTNLINKLRQERYSIDSQKNHFRGDFKIYTEHHHCPTCKQDISLEHRKLKLEEIKDKITKIDSEVNLIDDKIKELESIEKEYNKLLSDIRDTNSNIKEIESQMRYRLNRIKTLEAPQKPNNDLDDLKVKLDALEGQKTALERTLEQEEDNLEILEKIESSYEPVKAKTIKTFIPIINNFLNKYLKELSLDATFNFDEEFKEVIKTKYKEDYSYASFSEGEKMRINLALLLTWREISKLKNSFNCNLLILDEVCDSSLDHTGMTSFMNLIKSLRSNVIVISHREDVISDDFDCVIKVLKKRSTYIQKSMN